jgi:hypothetical protein
MTSRLSNGSNGSPAKSNGSEHPATPAPIFAGPEQILTTPSIDRAIDLLLECTATRAIGVITGDNGSGKTFALRALAGRYAKLNLPGNCVFYRCCQVQGPTRGVKDLLSELSGRGSVFRNGSSAGLQLLVREMLHELKKKDIRTLLLDEADLWEREALAGFVTCYDFCRGNDVPVTVIMTGTKALRDWIGAVPAGLSRTLRTEHFGSLSLTIMTSILQEWGEPFRQVVRLAKSGDAEAKRHLQVIHKHTGGNIRRLRFFAELLLLHQSDGEITRDRISHVFAKMINGGKGAVA